MSADDAAAKLAAARDAAASVPRADPGASWQPIDLSPTITGLADGSLTRPAPELLTDNHGGALLYRGKVHAFVGEPESCKGWLAILACAQVLVAGERVLYLDFEDDEISIVGRLLEAGVSATDVLAGFVYVRPEAELKAAWLHALIEHPFGLAVVDGVSEAFAVLGLDDWRETAKFLNQLVRPIALRGAAVVQIDHVVKSKDARGRYAIGGQGKLAGIQAQYRIEAMERPSVGHDGWSKSSC